MIRPCSCDRCEIGKPYDTSQCRLCWLYYNNNKYHKLWGGEQELPSLIQQGLNAVAAIANRVRSNFENVSKEDFEKRLLICGQCPNKTESWRCTKCGCFLNIKAKWSSEKCPENKWPLIMVEEKKGCGCGTKK